MDEEQYTELKEQIRSITERLTAIEREQRLIRQDILSDNPKANMKKRLLENPPENYNDKKERLDKEIKIEI